MEPEARPLASLAGGERAPEAPDSPLTLPTPITRPRTEPSDKWELAGFYIMDWANSVYSTIVISGFLPLLLQNSALSAAGFPGACPNYITNVTRVRSVRARAPVAPHGAASQERQPVSDAHTIYGRTSAARRPQVFSDTSVTAMFITNDPSTGCPSDESCIGMYCKGDPAILSGASVLGRSRGGDDGRRACRAHTRSTYGTTPRCRLPVCRWRQ